MGIVKKYIKGLKDSYEGFDLANEWNNFEKTIIGATDEDIEKIKHIYPDCPSSLCDMLKYVDGTYYRQYGDKEILFYFLGSDVDDFEYPYYLLSTGQICENKNIAIKYYSDRIARKYEEVDVDEKITTKVDGLKWLHFSDCMNNGGSSKLFIDFTPSASGKVGQIVRFLHDPDEFTVIADSFDEYLEMLIENEYEFINEEVAEELKDL